MDKAPEANLVQIHCRYRYRYRHRHRGSTDTRNVLVARDSGLLSSAAARPAARPARLLAG